MPGNDQTHRREGGLIMGQVPRKKPLADIITEAFCLMLLAGSAACVCMSPILFTMNHKLDGIYSLLSGFFMMYVANKGTT